MNIALIFTKTRPDTMGIYFENALRSLGHEVHHVEPSGIASMKKEYDLYFRVDDGFYDYRMPKGFYPKVFYATDVHLKNPERAMRKWILEGDYDLVFCPMLRWIKKMKGKSSAKIVWMNSGYDDAIHKRLDCERIYDVGFVRNDGGFPRKFYLQALRERYPNSCIGNADYKDMNKIYSSSKIGFSMPIRGEYFTLRNFEIMASGAMLLIKKLGEESAEKSGYFDSEHIVIFDSPEELFDIIDYYLEHEDERKRIAEKGYNLTVQKYSYKHSLAEMVGIAREEFGIR